MVGWSVPRGQAGAEPVDLGPVVPFVCRQAWATRGEWCEVWTFRQNTGPGDCLLPPGAPSAARAGVIATPGVPWCLAVRLESEGGM